MFRSFSILLAFICLVPFSKKKTRVIFLGDSLTELASRPGGFVRQLDSIALLQNEKDYQFIGSGVSGNKIYDLFLRLEDDVLKKRPHVVVILIGINDVWHKKLLHTGTDPDKFEKFYQAIIDRLRNKSILTILCTPTLIGEKTDGTNELDGELDRYAGIVRKLSVKNSLQLVDLRKVFLGYNRNHNPDNRESGILTYDKVHLSNAGNRLIAESLWPVVRDSRK